MPTCCFFEWISSLAGRLYLWRKTFWLSKCDLNIRNGRLWYVITLHPFLVTWVWAACGDTEPIFLVSEKKASRARARTGAGGKRRNSKMITAWVCRISGIHRSWTTVKTHKVFASANYHWVCKVPDTRLQVLRETRIQKQRHSFCRQSQKDQDL